MAFQWTVPVDYESRSVVVLGGGVLGRRIATCWCSAGYKVVIRDPNQQQCNEALQYIEENVKSYSSRATTGRPIGKASVTTDLENAVQGAWIIFEAVPEKLGLKIDTFAELEKLAPEDCILASNSSSYKSGEMLDKVKLDSTKRRILNTHYMMPPTQLVVEIMTDGHTYPELMQWLSDRHAEAGLSPYIAAKQSTGFIFNRVWAAVKRECLTVMAEGVSTPEQLDKIWKEMFGSSFGPCSLMDTVGLDTVAFIEKHYIEERGLSPELTVDFLQKNYLDKGKLGNKCDKGGFYPKAKPAVSSTPERKLIVLDVGLGQPMAGKAPAELMSGGRMLEVSLDGKNKRVLSERLSLPDGVDVCEGKLYYTNMGVPNKNDGSVFSANLDGTGTTAIVPPGTIHTPKQLVVDQTTKKLYISDREGCRVWRCNTDGSDIEILIEASGSTERKTPGDIMDWCVGVTVVQKLGKFFWTQKGPSKGSQGRIYSANIDMPQGCSAVDRKDISTVASNLAECIDLEYVEESNTLYWTDRGEIPFGNCLYKAQLGEDGEMTGKPQIIAQNFNEAIGLKVDAENKTIYVTDLGGSIWKCGMDGSDKQRLVYEESSCFTGLTIV